MKQKTMQIVDAKSISKECKITFIIGNGFDLGLNMKTSYRDVYEGYIQLPSSSRVIQKFKSDLSNSALHNYEKWSDFEMGMATYANTLLSENELIECVRDFKSYMVEHLQTENQKIAEKIRKMSNVYGILNGLKQSVNSFYGGLIPNDINAIKALINNANVIYNFITFNYTTTLEVLFATVSSHDETFAIEPIHIHGILNKDVVLGVDNEAQLRNAPFILTKKGHRAFIKTSFNQQYDKARVENAQRVINESSIICCYGFSMGESDKMWVEEIAQWLIADPNHHLVVYKYDNNKYNRYNFDELMDIEDEKKEQILIRLGIKDEHIINQIHIPISYDIFNFNFEQVHGVVLPYSK